MDESKRHRFPGFVEKGTILTRGISGALWVLFPVLRWLVPAVRRQPCYWKSLIRFGVLHPAKRDRYRICVVLNSLPASNLWGHAWLEKEDRNIETKKRRCGAVLFKVAENERFRFYIPLPGPEVQT